MEASLKRVLERPERTLGAYDEERAQLLREQPLAADRRIERLQQALESIDPEHALVLKAHAVLEEAVDEILSAYLQPIKEVEDLRLRQRIALARALSFDQHQSPVWSVLDAINSLRNAVVHPKDHTKLVDRWNELRKRYTTLEPGEDAAGNADLLLGAAAYVQGFLGAAALEAKLLRRWAHTLHRFPNEE